MLFLGVITSPDQVTEENASYYEAEYATDDNVEAYRTTTPIDIDAM